MSSPAPDGGRQHEQRAAGDGRRARRLPDRAPCARRRSRARSACARWLTSFFAIGDRAPPPCRAHRPAGRSGRSRIRRCRAASSAIRPSQVPVRDDRVGDRSVPAHERDDAVIARLAELHRDVVQLGEQPVGDYRHRSRPRRAKCADATPGAPPSASTKMAGIVGERREPAARGGVARLDQRVLDEGGADSVGARRCRARTERPARGRAARTAAARELAGVAAREHDRISRPRSACA